ncbi:hypothetical protein [Peptostreptococcus stomatis]
MAKNSNNIEYWEQRAIALEKLKNSRVKTTQKTFIELIVKYLGN